VTAAEALPLPGASRARTGTGTARWAAHRDPERDECYTPGWIVEWVRGVLGGIDLDPATCEQAQRTVRAARYHTLADDGLAQDWAGRVFLNPPWGGGQKRRWVDKLLDSPAVSAWVVCMSANFTSAAVADLGDAAAVVHISVAGGAAFVRPDGSTTGGWFSAGLFVGGPDLGEAALVPPGRGRWMTGPLTSHPPPEPRLTGSGLLWAAEGCAQIAAPRE